METFQRLWRNEYFKTVITIILIIAIVFGFWLGFQAALGTEYPALAVASTSMLPTLNVGDLIIVQHVDPAYLNANYTTGDIVVFKHPVTGKLIVHRAVKKELRNDVYWITTHGDNNPPGADENFPEQNLVGKVIVKIPFVGNFALLLHSQGNVYLLIFLIILISIIILTFPFTTEDESEPVKEEKQTEKRKRLFGKIDVKTVYVLILNLLIISFAIFSLWGAFTFWQPGADPPQAVTIRGMYPDLQYHESFKNSHNYVNGTILSQGFLTYKIDDCLLNGSVRQGVPTFSWLQFSILILCIVDVWTLFDYLMERRETEQQEVLSEPKAL